MAKGFITEWKNKFTLHMTLSGNCAGAGFEPATASLAGRCTCATTELLTTSSKKINICYQNYTIA